MRSKFVESFWEPRKGPLVFFGVAYLFGISVNVASNHIQGRFWTPVFLYGIPTCIAVFILSPWAVRFVGRLWRVAHVEGAHLKAARRHEGLVVFASKGLGIATARAAIEYHRPKHVWIYCSTTSDSDAHDLASEVVRNNLMPTEGIHLLALTDDDFADPEAVRARIESDVYAGLSDIDLAEGDVVIDFTGGKKETTAGALLAGLLPGRHLEVVRPSEVEKNMRGEQPGEILEIDLRYKLRPAK
jgi:hypothetical protein